MRLIKYFSIFVLFTLPLSLFANDYILTDTLKPKKKLKKTISKPHYASAILPIPVDARSLQVRNNLGWEWMQKKHSSFFGDLISNLNPINNPVTRFIFGPDKINLLDSVNLKEDIDYYMLDALRVYIFSPASNPIGEIWENQTNDAVRKLYGDYLLDYHDSTFWKLALTASIDNRGGDIQKCKEAFDFISANGHPYISIAKEAIKKGRDDYALFILMYKERHNMDACTWIRATYRDNRQAFIDLLFKY
ncbi:MAG: hypothetical protein JST87_12000 [Bacteroidetes bacterium]|nr:hypothetical protein [Bacteroidota bacterium]